MLKTKIRILYIGPIPPEVGGKSPGGIAIHCWQLATQAHKRGYDVYVLANTASSFIKEGVKVISQSQRQRSKLSKAFYTLKFWLIANKNILNSLNFLSLKQKVSVLYGACLLKEVIRLVNPHLIHIHSLHNVQTLSLKLLKKSAPLIITHYESYSCAKRGKTIAILNSTVSMADYLICCTEYNKDKLKELGIKYSKNSKIIHIPVDTGKVPLLEKEEIRHELGFDNKKKVVLFSGVYKPIKKKGLDILLRAFCVNRYLRDNCKLIVHSNEEGIKYANKIIERENIDGILLGTLPWKKLVKYYNASDIFVMPSRSEGFGIVYVEALLTGCPIIGFHGTLKEIKSVLGIYVGEKFDASKENENSLAEKIIKVLNTNLDRDLLRRKTIESLSWDAKFSEFGSVYQEALRNRLQK